MPINNFSLASYKKKKNKDNQCESVVKSTKNVVVLQRCKLLLNTEKPDLERMEQFLHCAKPQCFREKKKTENPLFQVGVYSFIFQASEPFPLESPRELESSGFPKVSKSRRKTGK